MWVIIAGEGLAAVMSLSPGVGGARLVYFGLASLIVQWITFIALATLYLFRRRLRTMKVIHVVYISLGLLMASAWLVVAALWWLLRDLLPEGDADWRQLLLRLSAIILIVGVLGVAALQNHWQARQAAVRAKQSELEALQARIRPHFLFNTLNSGVALVRQQPGQAEELLLGLSDLFRAALSNPHDIELSEELALVRRYLDIESIRFGPRLRTSWQLPDAMPSVKVPALSIQPMVENAVRHGIERLPGGGEIAIGVEVEADAVVVSIRNPMPPASAELATGHSIGLPATLARIAAITEGRGSVATTAMDGDYVVTITLPLQSEAAAG